MSKALLASKWLMKLGMQRCLYVDGSPDSSLHIVEYTREWTHYVTAYINALGMKWGGWEERRELQYVNATTVVCEHSRARYSIFSPYTITSSSRAHTVFYKVGNPPVKSRQRPKFPARINFPLYFPRYLTHWCKILFTLYKPYTLIVIDKFWLFFTLCNPTNNFFLFWFYIITCCNIWIFHQFAPRTPALYWFLHCCFMFIYTTYREIGEATFSTVWTDFYYSNVKRNVLVSPLSVVWKPHTYG